MCDGLGACIGHCPEEAITFEEREAEPYDEILVIKEMLTKGKNTIVAHFKHLKDHNETEYLKQGLDYLKHNQNAYNFELTEVIDQVFEIEHATPQQHQHSHAPHAAHMGACPGSQSQSFKMQQPTKQQDSMVSAKSELTHWPVQLHLINPIASHFKNADLLLAADCVAFSLGNFHQNYLKGRVLAIACPKLDQGKEIYVEKLRKLIDESKVNTITVMKMEVPCCGGILQMAMMAAK